jgi:signal transduction histidine kinase
MTPSLPAIRLRFIFLAAGPVLLAAFLDLFRLPRSIFYLTLVGVQAALLYGFLRCAKNSAPAPEKTPGHLKEPAVSSAGKVNAGLDFNQAQLELVQQQRLRALGQMAGGIAHDFNNALAPILGYSELLLDTPSILDNKEKTTEYLKIINIAARDAANVVRHLREFYRPRDKNDSFSAIDLNALVRQTVTLTQPKWKTQALTAGAEIQVLEELQKIPLIEGDEAELREVLTNLIFNAVDAMPKGGTLKLCTFTKGSQVILEIQDNGTGMSEEVREQCFEPFFTTKGREGTGLGLAMVYGIIQRHGGKIEVTSEPEKGTAFSIALPAFSGNKSEEVVRPGKSAGRFLKILYVEDEAPVREVVRACLKRDGHDVDEAVNGLEGLKKFMLGHYDLVITDNAMPGMTGVQLAAAIKKRMPGKPVILLSGTEEGENLRRVADTVVLKPVTLDVLRAAIFGISNKIPQ